MEISMKIKIEILADTNFIMNLVEESEKNESSFVKNFCDELLQQIGMQTKHIAQVVNEINKINPCGEMVLR